MGTMRAYRRVLVISSLLFFTITINLGKAFVPTAAVPADAPRKCSTSGSLSALHPERSAGNHAPSTLTKQPAPPLLSVPVFSLATVNEDGSTNMNIVTYASPVGIKPERLWIVSLYQSTLSYENFLREGWGVLQVLRRKHAPLVPLLGQNGGRDTDKAGRCAGEAFPWDQPPCELLSVPRSVAVVPDAVSYMTLRMVSKQPAGDHDAVLCRVDSVVGPDEDQEASANSQQETLETRHLRDAGII